MANNDHQHDSHDDSMLEQAVDSALDKTHQATGATSGEIFWAAVGATLLGFFLVNLSGVDSIVTRFGYVAMATGAFAALVLRRKI